MYTPQQVQEFVSLYLEGADREKVDPILDRCVATYQAQLDEDKQVAFKGQAKSFVRTYDFLASVLTYNNADWERLSILLTLLVPKLPTPIDEEVPEDILKLIDMDSYRVQKRTAMAVALADEDATIAPVPVSAGGGKPEPEVDRLSIILRTFNEQFGTQFADTDRVMRRIL